MNIIKDDPIDRKINWICDLEGNRGKSFLRKYLCLNYECIICDGKKDNVLNSIKVKCIDENKRIYIIIMDIPRYSKDFVNYGLLEQIKDGHVYSGKYEGGEIWLGNVHVIVFSNQDPEFSKMSQDRWNYIML